MSGDRAKGFSFVYGIENAIGPMNRKNPDDVRREAAAAWFAALRRGPMSVEERAEFDSWRADPLNQAALDRMHELWGETAALKSLDAPVWRGRSRFSLAAGLAAALVLFAVIGAGFLALAPLNADARIQTAIGEQTTQPLPDGSVVAVNVVSRLSYDMNEERRLVTLAEGEAAFFVQRDPARPFLVRAGDYEIRAVGTAFNVRRRGDELDVAVSDGAVAIVARRGRRSGELLARLAAGQALRLPASDASRALKAEEAVYPLPVARVAEWRIRVITYEDAAVADVVADLNRFFERPVQIAEPDLAQRRVTLRLEVDDREEALETLARLLKAEIRPSARADALTAEAS